MFQKDRNNEYFKNFRKEFKIDDLQIFSLFKNNHFLRIMNTNHRILPFIFDDSLLLEFRKEININL